jgi:hypothetical protein
MRAREAAVRAVSAPAKKAAAATLRTITTMSRVYAMKRF